MKMKTHRHPTPSRSFIANQPSPKFGAILGVKELKSKYQGTSWNKDMVKIEEYDDGRVPSGSEHALVPYVPKGNLSDGNLASGVVIAKEEGGPSSSSSNLRSHFIGMGFSSELVEKVLQENGEDDANIILETSFKYSALEEQVIESSGSLGGLFSFDSDGEVQVPSGSHTSKPYLNSKVSPDRCNVKMETNFSTTKGKRSYTSLTSDAGFYYEDKNNEGENRQDLPEMPIHGSVVELSEKDETGMYKNLLQEKAQKASLELPVYTTTRSGPGHSPVFSSVVELGGISFRGAPAKKKEKG